MEKFNNKAHWDKIYHTKELKDVSWYQAVPETSLGFLKQFKVSKNAKIIDVGGGDSLLVDYLIKKGYKDITVLDISSTALEKAKQRLGKSATKVKWIVSDITCFEPTEKYDFWHDRATFHFLTNEKEINKYLQVLSNGISSQGVLVLSTFSESGPEKCSGIKVKQYSELSLINKFKKVFEKVKCITVDHKTPFNTIQNFIFCSFRKKLELI
ncbi:MAG TPA: class I SAM-dependent methyltransferase [Saprospiraceae bacterium]|nr:class I SAM-dependent methyltransferase [Saprospiraceae bacterium]